MEIVFNTAKDAINREKHGVSLGTASDFEWDEAVTWPDERRDYAQT